MLKKALLSIIFLLPVCAELMATHIRAGEIIAQRISSSSFQYRFSIIGYTDTGSTVEFAGGTIDFGDGRVENLNDVFEGTPEFFIIEDEVAFNRYDVVHTFPGPGRYVVRYNEQNRNAGVVNMSNSVDTPFYIETEILIDPAVGQNNTPSFLIAPIDRGAEGATFLHNPGAFDPDGDSLSYRLTTPKQFFDRAVNDYVEPNDAQFYTNFLEGNQNSDGPPIFEIDSITGTVTWDAPGLMGEYNIAFVVDEWRRIGDTYARIGSVTRDMQIIIEETDNLPPIIEQPEELCIEAGELLETVIIATDPDGHDIELEAFGGPFTFNVDPATFTPFPVEVQPQPASMTISWQTDISHVRERPYEIQLKARDVPGLGPRLVDFKTLLVTVVAPAPENVSLTLQENRKALLEWDQYALNADSIEIWRRVDSFEIDTTECIVGMPANAGYMLIDRVSNRAGATSYLDDNGGFGLAPGALYCYRLVARFPLPAGGSSYVSEEVCQLVEVIAPVTLNVDVTRTGENDGQIYLRWTSPFDVDEEQNPRPFSYDVYRFTEIGGADSALVTFTQDTIITDTGLNSAENQYFYRIHAYNADVVEGDRRPEPGYGPYIDSSIPASSVWLTAVSQVETIDLSWQANTPWSIVAEDYPQHYIYRAVEDGFGSLDFSLIDSVTVTESGQMYSDDGSFNGEPLDEDVIYHYFVQTQGTYGNDVFPAPLLNKSQEISAQPNDLVPPCTPVSFQLANDFNCEEFLATRGCDFSDFSVTLSWQEDGDSVCDNDIESYNIYYAQEDTVGGLGFLTNVVGTQFVHEGKTSFKGFYQISSVDRSGNESELSEIIVTDNCPNIRLPNAFSPNGDGVNDTFTPFTDFISSPGNEGEGVNVPDFDNANCPRFVQKLNFKVFDRTGGTLFTFDSDEAGSGGESDTDFDINWDGTNNNGRKLPSGTYYYKMDVVFDALNPDLRSRTYNGWIQLIR